MKNKPELKFHEKSCYLCRYYRQTDWNGGAKWGSECLLLGRTLSITQDIAHDRARVCDGYKKRPQKWEIHAKKNPHWFDRYIPRETLLRLRKRILGLGEKND